MAAAFAFLVKILLILAGTISSGTARKLVRDWARHHRLELMINWRNIEKGRPLNRIRPLE